MRASKIEQAGRLQHGRVVTVQRRGQRLRIEPPCPPLLMALQTAMRTVESTAPVGYKVVTQNTPLFAMETECARRVLKTGAGLEPVVRKVLTDTGCTIRDIGISNPPLPSLAVDALKKHQPIDIPLLDCVQRLERALIRINAAVVRPARLIAQVALAWPEQTITVVGTRLEDAHQLAGELGKLVGGVSVISGQENPAVVERVVVTTYKGLGHSAMYRGQRCKAFDHSHLDIVIALDAVEAVGKKPMEYLLHCDRARLYGLLDVRARPAPLEKDRMAALFGFHEVVIPAHGHHERPVAVSWLRLESYLPLPKGADALTIKQQGIWNCPIRNRQIVRLARRFQGQAIVQEAFPAMSVTRSTTQLILVENVEHGLVLAKRLPGWQFIHGPAVYCGHAKPMAMLDMSTDDTMPTTQSNAVVTMSTVNLVGLNHFDVVIRADGGTGLPPLPESGLIQPNHAQPRPLLLVDFADRHHPQLRRQSRWRKQAYEERGWFGAGVNPVAARVERFLASRPKEGQA